MKKGWAVVSDFDGTITMRDVGDQLLLHYGFADRETIERSYLPGVRAEDFMKKAFAAAALSEKTIADFVRRKVKARRGFREFALSCGAAGVPLEVASGGIDLYAEPFFRKHGISVKSFFGNARASAGGIRISYPFLRGTTLSAFKASRVVRFRSAGYRVAFFGDGPSDLEAAALSDKVYAAGRLLKLCRNRGVPACPLADYSGAASFIRRGGAGRKPPGRAK